MSEGSDYRITKHLQYIRGLPFTYAPRFTRENIEATFEYVPRSGDIVVASYPKTGTTWLQYIILQILSRGQCFPKFNDLMFKVAPYMELAGISTIEALKEPRVYKHHLPYNMVRKNPQAKYFYIYRKPEDTLLSYYHFTQSMWNEVIDFDEYFEDFLEGNVSYGSYFEHISSYISHRNDGNLFVTTYEKLHANLKKEICRIANFLGEKHYQDISSDEVVLTKIMEHTNFDYMKKNLYYDHPDMVGKRIDFFRRGLVGEGRQTLSPDQLKHLRNTIEKMSAIQLINEWY